MSAGSILVVEDDRDIRETLSEALEEEGYEVVGAKDGIEAIERLRAATRLPHLVLLDLMMPRMNGLEFREAMVQVDAWKSIPVLLLTADAQARTRANALGVDAYLEKPVKLAALLGAVARLVELSVRTRTGA